MRKRWHGAGDGLRWPDCPAVREGRERWPLPALSIIVLSAAACVMARQLPVDPGVTFAAHEAHGGLVIDRMKSVRHAELMPLRWVRLPGDPTFLLRSECQTVAALWLRGPAHVEVRQDGSTAAPLIGGVDADWDGGAIRLTLRPANDAPLRAGPFQREDTGTGPAALSRTVETSLDIAGTYRAALRGPSGLPNGWLRVRVSPYGAGPPRVYEAMLPPSLDDNLAAAAVVVLGTEIDWIQSHALDLYRGM